MQHCPWTSSLSLTIACPASEATEITGEALAVLTLLTVTRFLLTVTRFSVIIVTVDAICFLFDNPLKWKRSKVVSRPEIV